MNENQSISEVASNHYMLVTFKATGLTVTKTDKVARSTLAAANGVDETQYRVSKVLLPSGYDAEFKVLRKALSAAQTDFYNTTMAFSRSADGSAAGKRLVSVSAIMPPVDPKTGVAPPSWIAKFAQHSKDIAAHREAFAAAMPSIMARISADPMYSTQYDAGQYPTPDQIRESFRFSIEGPEPIARGTSVPLTGKLAKALEQRFERQIQEQLTFGQQQLATGAKCSMLHYARVLAERTAKLVEHMDTGDGKAPQLYATVTGNLESIAAKAREYAVAGTDVGDALLKVADKITADIVPPGRTAEDLKGNAPLARSTSEKAAELAQEIEDMDVFF